ncbi:MAG TPA: ROK family transcriptional regulator [Flavisolibacter sp.]|jgi:predicted NBD/HSP70 family sugar kinase|nr:ROK family transcriptional regulator [Flavisolibacter sp.]
MSKLLFEVFSDENTNGVAYKNKAHKRAIISYLDGSGNATVADLSRELNISTPKIITLVNELIQDGLIKDNGKIDSTGGRRASLYGLVAEAAFFIGVDVKRYSINIGLLDFKKSLVTIKEDVPYELENSQESFDDMIKVIKEFIGELTIAKEKIVAVGINLSGRINNANGYSYSFFHFHEEPLAGTIETLLGIRTFLENDSRAMAYGEFCCGSVTKERNVLFVNMDYGTGLGILVDGKVYYGKSGFSGEFGHIPFFNNEIICQCGKRGCLETEASGNALIRLFKDKLKTGSTSQLLKKVNDLESLKLQQIIEAAQNDDMLSIELIAEIGEKIGRGIALLINIFNPELVLLGGTLAQTGDYIRLPIRSALNKYSLSLVNNDSQLKMSKLGEKAGVIGGCLMARNKVFASNKID